MKRNDSTPVPGRSVGAVEPPRQDSLLPAAAAGGDAGSEASSLRRGEAKGLEGPRRQHGRGGADQSRPEAKYRFDCQNRGEYKILIVNSRH